MEKIDAQGSITVAEAGIMEIAMAHLLKAMGRVLTEVEVIQTA